MKKLLLSLSTIIMTGTTGIAAVSCGVVKPLDGEVGQRVFLVTDSGSVDDKSFNEQSWDAMRDYTISNYELSSSKNYTKPRSTSTTDMKVAYTYALKKQADAIILPGFNHLNNIEWLSNQAEKEDRDISIILIDAIADPSLENVISITFNSELSGFAAAFDAALWATTTLENESGESYYQGDANGDGEISFGTFAGMDSKFGVNNYNWGFLLGVHTFNLLNEANNEIPTIKFANTTDGTLNNFKVTGASDASFFSGSFEEQGTNNKIVKDLMGGTSLVSGKADVIFPVAGPQIDDIFSNQGSYGYKPYVIGVDTNQVELYSNHKDQFLSSATKNLHEAIIEALGHSKALIDSDGNKHTDTWDGQSKTGVETNWSYNYTGGNNLIPNSSINFEGAESSPKTALIDSVKNSYNVENTSVNVADYMNYDFINSSANTLLNNTEIRNWLTSLG